MDLETLVLAVPKTLVSLDTQNVYNGLPPFSPLSSMFTLRQCGLLGRRNHVLMDEDTTLNLCVCVLILVGSLVFGAICF